MRVSASVKFFTALALLAAPLRAQCAPPQTEQPKVHDSLLVSTAWLAQHLHDPNLVIIHVDHMSDTYAGGHIPGARRLDAMKFAVRDFDLPAPGVLDSTARALGIGDHSRVVIYGDPWVTGLVFVGMDVLGLGDRTAILDGGLQAWKAEGRPLSTATPAIAPATLTMRHEPDHVADADWVRAHQSDRQVDILDVRSPVEYRGDGSGMEATRGHISGARLVEYSRVFAHQERTDGNLTDTHLIPVADLQALFREAGVHAGITPLTYCTVGMRASQMYFILRYLGYQPKFYDGSYNDWVRHHYALTTGSERGTP